MKNVELELAAVEEGLSFIPADDRDLWVKIAMALKDEFGEDAKDAWMDWSATAKAFDANAAASVWKSVKPGKVTIASFVYEAKQFGWRPKRSAAKRITPEEYERKQREREKRRLDEEARERERNERAARRAAALWGEAEPAESHPYLTRKGIQPHGARIGQWSREWPDPETGELIQITVDGALLIPVYSSPGKIATIQAVFPARHARMDRDKDYLPGGAKQGGYYPLGKVSKSTTRLIVAEGFATGASVHEATNSPVLVAFDSGNLLQIAEHARKMLPDAEIIIAGDNDLWTKGNPGARKANAAAFAVGGKVALPIFADYEGNPTDFNDLRDPAEIRAQIDGAIGPVDPERFEPDTRLAAPPAPVEEPPEPDPAEEAPEPVPDGEVLDLGEQPEQPTDEDAYDDVDDDIDPSGYFRILGYDHDRYYVFQAESKQIAVLSVASFTDAGFIRLAPLNWWEMNFPGDKGFDKRLAINWFMRLAHSRGIYNPNNTRGRGAWMDKGRVVLHLGNELVVDGAETPITKIDSRYVYELRQSLPGLHHEAMDSDDGERIIEIARKFRWTRPASAAMISGWIALAPLCGALKWRPHVWVSGGAGCGKSLCNSSPILTPQGWTTMGAIKVGDLVSTPDNSYGEVLGVYPQGVLPVFKVTFVDGRTVRCSGDHLWKVRIKHKWRIRTTDQMREILSRGTRSTRSLAIPLCEPMTIKGNRKLALPLHPYVLGALLCDGSLSGGVIGFTSVDAEIIDRVARLAPEGIDLVKASAASVKEFRFKGLDALGHRMRGLVKELRLIDCLSGKKYIPRDYLDASIEDRIELLKGLMDTDGHAGKGGSISYCTISECLRDGVVELVQSLGGIASVAEKHTSFTYKGERREGQLAYNINIRFSDPTIAFSLKRKLERVSADHQYSDCLYLNVSSIEPDGEEECSCIMVDHPDRLYVTKEFVVTHNTTLLNDFVHRLCAGMDVYAQGNSTEAGIRQRLQMDALPVLFDESEQNNDREMQRVQAILALIRQSSSESDAQTLKGTTDGESRAFYIRSMFCLSSIQVGIKNQADSERLAILSLRPKRDTDHNAAEEWAKLKELLYSLKSDEDLPSRLVRRSLDLLPITLRNIDIFARAGAEKFGSQRDGDQYGTLMAGAWSLISTREATPEEAREMFDRYDWTEYMEHTETDEARQALNTIMGALLRLQGGATLTVHEVLTLSQGFIMDGVADIKPASAEALLGRYGIKIRGEELLFATSAAALGELVADTPFAADIKGQLLRVPGARRYPDPVWVSGATQRCVSVPLAPLLDGVKDLPKRSDDDRDDDRPF